MTSEPPSAPPATTSEGLVSSEYLPDPRQLISAQYARVGATTQHLEVSGARSIYENEAANVAVGSTVGYEERVATTASSHLPEERPAVVQPSRSARSGPSSGAWSNYVSRSSTEKFMFL